MDLHVPEEAKEVSIKNMENMNEYASDGSACIYISATPDKLGTITKCNSATCQIFGYPKLILIGCNIKILMPLFLANRHQEILSKRIQKEERKDLNYTKVINSFAKHCSGYVFPVVNVVRHMISYTGESNQFVSLIHIPRNTIRSKELYIIINSGMQIIEISELCVRILGLKKEIIEKQRIQITNFFKKFPSYAELSKKVYEDRSFDIDLDYVFHEFKVADKMETKNFNELIRFDTCQVNELNCRIKQYLRKL